MSVVQLKAEIEPLRQNLLRHSVYESLRDPAALRTFMQHHVFAVWDFMSLLKALQQRLTCTAVPWIAPSMPLGGRLINEIVLGEESDEDGQGGFASHFELYHRSMVDFGADTRAIDRFVEQLRAGQNVEGALCRAEIVPAVASFIRHTFATITGGDNCQIAAAFTFGREDLLPDVFQKIVDELSRQAHGKLAGFQYYLQRHIDLDSDEHGPMAARLVEGLCGADPAAWQRATDAARQALQARLALWDGIYRAIQSA